MFIVLQTCDRSKKYESVIGTQIFSFFHVRSWNDEHFFLLFTSFAYCYVQKLTKYTLQSKRLKYNANEMKNFLKPNVVTAVIISISIGNTVVSRGIWDKYLK